MKARPLARHLQCYKLTIPEISWQANSDRANNSAYGCCAFRFHRQHRFASLDALSATAESEAADRRQSYCGGIQKRLL
jgi:hypothetical protein